MTDCIGVLLGGHARHAEELRVHPATFWFSKGFMQNGGQPGLPGKGKELFSLKKEVGEEYLRILGEEKAADLLVEWEPEWVLNHDHGAFVRSDYPGAAGDCAFAHEFADSHDWTFSELPADLSLLRRMMSGEWAVEDFAVIVPGQQVMEVQDGLIITSVSPAEAERMQSGAVCEETVTFLVDNEGGVRYDEGNEAVTAEDLHEGLGLGIDAGGTYTDAALYDFATRSVIASGKGLTTPHNPAIGIREALSHLPPEHFPDIRLVSLATTFATNAIVEGKGRKTGLLLAGYDEWSLARIEHRPCRLVPDHPQGHAQKTPELERVVTQAVRELIDQENIQALAVVAISACFDPAHEKYVAEIARGVCDLPMVCGHELSSEINSLLRAATAALNARIAPVVVDLVRSMEAMLVQCGIHAPLAIVRANGSLYGTEEACRRPVEMILSGPAASMAGAHALTGLEEAIVVDIGGTTSDVSLLKSGRPVDSRTGAVVGNHRTAVHAPAIWTTGLGGDSHIQVFPKRGEITVGPRRVLPVCYVAAVYGDILPHIQELELTSLAELRLLQPAELFVLLREPESAGFRPEGQEVEIVELLRSGPKTVLDLSRALDYPFLSCLRVTRLEEAGVLIRSGLTPTDLLHAQGEFERWDCLAARRALGLVAGRMGWLPEELNARARQAFCQKLCEILLTAGMGIDHVERLKDDPVTRRLVNQAFSGAEESAPAHCRIAFSVPVVGIGAAALSFVPEVARILGTTCVVPERAGVAGAVGAITGLVVEEVRIVIEPREEGDFNMRAPDEARVFSKLQAAKDYARVHATDLVRQRAQRSGAGRFHVRLHIEDRQASINPNGILYVETRIVAQAVGAPRVS